jgi:hypothetical protein
VIVFRVPATPHPAIGKFNPACQSSGTRGALARMIGIRFDPHQISR